MSAGIYIIENLINHKVYIGQSLDIHVRFLAHKSYLRRNCHGNEYLQRSWNKYGEDNFSFKIIEECPNEMLNAKETYWCEFYKNQLGKENVYNLGHTGQVSTMSYNQKQKISNAKKNYYKNHPEALLEMSLSRTGEKNPMYGICQKNHPMFGKHHTQEAKEKIRLARLGKKQSEATKNKKRISESGINNPMYGKHHTEETKRKMSESRKGRHISEDQKKKLSIILSNSTWMNNGEITKMIKPNQIDTFMSNGWVKGRLKLKERTKK